MIIPGDSSTFSPTNLIPIDLSLCRRRHNSVRDLRPPRSNLAPKPGGGVRYHSLDTPQPGDISPPSRKPPRVAVTCRPGWKVFYF
ncbi:hypothetical protein MTP99_015585 [Tenebrio molitor]|nr:hypothetical protein MTP99_015585 [Tenebrio molitor]